jgi:acyl-CoA synthetase (AMP-forming)/AMP-acid ligase II
VRAVHPHRRHRPSDDEGFLTLLDRKKDLVISGGYNIYPSDIEVVLCGHARRRRR